MTENLQTSRHIVEWTDQEGTRCNAAIELGPELVRMGQGCGAGVAGAVVPRERFMTLLRMVAREAGVLK